MREQQYEDILDEEGNVIGQGERMPFTDFQDYHKLVALMGKEPDCDTRGGKFTAWRDSSPQPSYDEIEAVTDEDAALAVLPRSGELVASEGEAFNALLDLMPGMRTRLLNELLIRRGK